MAAAASAAPAAGQWWRPSEFSAPALLSGPSSDGVALVHAIDLDGDGDEDLVVASQADERLVWHEALVGAGFGPAQVIAEGALRIGSLDSGDVDGDGDVDLVVASGVSPVIGAISRTGVLWFEALGGGSFRPAPRLVVDVPERDLGNVGLLDVEGDGDLDVVCTRFFGGAVLLARNQGSAFAAPIQVATVEAFGPQALAIGDLDADGREDLVVASYDSALQFGALRRFRNLGGTFAAGQTFGFQAPGNALAVEDADADGDLDVLSSRSDGLAIHVNDGAGGFGATVLVPAGAGAARVEARDVDGDGDTDVAFSFAFVAGLTVAPRTGPATFGAAAVLEPGSPAFTFADFDLDGDLDVAGGGGATRVSVYVRFGLGGGAYAPAQDLGAPAALAPSDAALFDLDLDGDLDALACGLTDGKVVWFENVGGAFGPASLVGVVTQPYRVAAGDLDGDGDVDVLASGTSATWFPRQGAGFGAGVVLRASALDAVPADMDADGDLDVVIASDDAIRWRVNQGAGVFGPALTVASGFQSAPGDVHVADLDGNGFLDVIAVGNAIEPIVVVSNLGGTFGAKQILMVPFAQSPLHRVGAGDIDGDGRLDVLGGGPSFFWLRNLGGHTYAPWEWAGFFGEVGAGFAPADVDGDGDLDFVHVYDNTDGELVLWRENTGGGNLTTEHLVTDRAPGPWGVAVGDVDGDGDPDVVSTSVTSHSVLLHENTVARVITTCAQPVPNSSSAAGRLRVTGSFAAADNRLVLAASSLPLAATGYFLTSRLQGNVPMPGGSRGTLCLGGAIGRFTGPGQVRNSGNAGQFALALDLTAHPTPTGTLSVLANEIWYFQAWHRDTFQGAATSNFTEAVGVWFE